MGKVRFRACAIPIVVVMLSLAGASTAFAQALLGNIAGTVVDSTGGALPGATVTATQPSIDVTRTTVTNAEGAFRLDGLPVGGYTVKIEMPSFSPLIVTLTTPLAGREVRDLGKLVMKVGGMSETVEVTSAVTPVQVTDSSRIGTITADDFTNIQMKGRDIFGILQVVPGRAGHEPESRLLERDVSRCRSRSTARLPTTRTSGSTASTSSTKAAAARRSST